LICGLIVVLVNLLLYQSIGGAAVVGPSVFLTVILASVIGAIAPALFKRLGIDPAVASGPLVTTTNDVLGILIYFGLAYLLIGLFPGPVPG
jgi:magnesium transporter